MRPTPTLIALAALACTACSDVEDSSQSAVAPSQPVRPEGITEAARTVDAFHAALGRGDTAAALSFLADDAMIFEQGAVERSKAEYAAHHLAADATFAQAVPSVRSKRTGRVEGDAAWIASEGRTTGRYKDKAVDRVTTETMVLRRQGGDWAVVHIHWSSGAAPEG